jgi:pimeloyl-ACP methyl ester carboxylesterase
MDHFVADDGEEIRLRISGEGPPLVLLHEWASSHRIWEPFVQRFAPSFTVYRWDARGHGGHRPRAPERCTVSRMADDLAALLGRYGVDRPVVVGHSLGALVLWEYIARHGCGRLGRIVILDQSPKLLTGDGWRLGIYGDWTADRNAAFIAGLERDFAGTVLRLVGEGLNARARARHAAGDVSLTRLGAYLRSLDPAPLIACWRSLSDGDWRPVLPQITCPALLIYGADSNYYLPATGEYVRDAVPGSRLVVYAGADHAPHVCFPLRFCDDVEAFAGAGGE